MINGWTILLGTGGLTSPSEAGVTAYNWEMILAVSTVGLALATVFLAIGTFCLARESKKASIRQIGVQTFLDFRRQFDCAEFIKARKSLAKAFCIPGKFDPQEIREDVMNF